MYTYFQFTGGGDFVSWIAWFVLMAVFFMFYPRIMIGQIMWKIEKSAIAIEKMAKDSKKIVVSKITKKPNKELKD